MLTLNDVQTKRFRKLCYSVAIASLAVMASAAAFAQSSSGGTALPRILAVEAASEAVRACEASGYKVTAVVVDAAGEMRALVKGDGSTPHTKETAFRKAIRKSRWDRYSRSTP